MKNESRIIKEQIKKTQYRENSSPIYMTSSFSFESAEQAQELFHDAKDENIYSRFSNPNSTDLIRKICLLENAQSALTTASGMAAVFSVFAALLKQGDHILAANGIFGSTHQVLTKILPNYGITHNYVDLQDIDSWTDSLKDSSKIVFLETPTNPGLEVIDLRKAAKFCKRNNLLLVVDNTFTSPILQKPFDFDADIVVHSATKFLDGQGRALGGLILGNEELLSPIKFFLRQTGPSMSPFNAWILSKSLETLKLRIERQSETAFEIAKELEKDLRINKVIYPFLESHPSYQIAKDQMKAGGSIITFFLDRDLKGSYKFLNNLKLITQTANLGDVKTLITHPFTTTHSKLSEDEKSAMNITDNLIRLSIGIEDKEDILEDLLHALDA